MNQTQATYLAIESSTQHLSIVLYRDKLVLGKRELSKAFAASEQTASLVQELLNEHKAHKTITHILVNNGPGSFTGLRVAHSFAKGFAIATGSKVVGISAFDQLFSQHDTDVAVIESKRDEAYFMRRNGKAQLLKKTDLATHILENETIICQELKDFATFLPSNPLIEQHPQAETLCTVFDSQIAVGADLTEADIIYFHHFEKPK
jgi:tRNA threonylcarbamoyl adenosine modification protein YeaZ